VPRAGGFTTHGRDYGTHEIKCYSYLCPAPSLTTTFRHAPNRQNFLDQRPRFIRRSSLEQATTSERTGSTKPYSDSGGIDSALSLVVAVDALGSEAVTAVSMPSHYTAETNREDAAELTRRLGVRLLEIPIQELVAAYNAALIESFSGTKSNVAEENLQARIRGNLLMALSNKFGWLVLTTGNKSEMSVGYATLYGDMAGGFSILKDVLKTRVYMLSRWRNLGGEVIPQRIIDKAPSAELRPDQLDTDNLPPYDVLDAILQAYVEEDRDPSEIEALGFDRALVDHVVAMVDRAEYKRRQAAPGVRISARAFGKDRRLPITNQYRPD